MLLCMLFRLDFLLVVVFLCVFLVTVSVIFYIIVTFILLSLWSKVSKNAVKILYCDNSVKFENSFTFKTILYWFIRNYQHRCNQVELLLFSTVSEYVLCTEISVHFCAIPGTVFWSNGTGVKFMIITTKVYEEVYTVRWTTIFCALFDNN